MKDEARQDKTRHDKTTYNIIKQDLTRQDKTRQNNTRQYKTREVNTIPHMARQGNKIRMTRKQKKRHYMTTRDQNMTIHDNA